MKPGFDIHIIAAMTSDRVIGCRGKLPWDIPEDLALFRRLTIGHTVIMGRNTYDGIGHPLDHRHNIVITSRPVPSPNVESFPTFAAGLDRARSLGGKIFCIGGEGIFRAALPEAAWLHITWIEGEYSGDTYFPAFDPGQWHVVARKKGPHFTHITYCRKQH